MNLLWAVAIILPVLTRHPATSHVSYPDQSLAKGENLLPPADPITFSSLHFARPPAHSGTFTLPSLPATVQAIPLPPGYERMPAPASSFAVWLRHVPLKKSQTVYLYNGMPKRNQSAQFAVLDVPVGDQDLQQCADAVMRLRAEYLFAFRKWDEILFRDNAGRAYCYSGGQSRAAFEQYLRRVFGWCGTASLEKQLKPVKQMALLEPGDVLIKGGFPGHAVIVMDAAVNRAGDKIYILAQSYMPAQDIHILKNPVFSDISPWYKVSDNHVIMTPEWTFYSTQLRRW